MRATTNPTKIVNTIVGRSPSYIGSVAGVCRAFGEEICGSDASIDRSPRAGAGETTTGAADAPKFGLNVSTGPAPGPGVESHESVYPRTTAPRMRGYSSRGAMAQRAKHLDLRAF